MKSSNSNIPEAEDSENQSSKMNSVALSLVTYNDIERYLTAIENECEDDFIASLSDVQEIKTNSGGNRIPPNTVSVEVSDEMEHNMPFIPESVYKSLPRFLKNLCEVFSDRRERDVFLTSALGVLSGCFTSISGVYDGDRVYANLFMFILAPAASGKGSMVWAKRIADPLHKQWAQESEQVPERTDEGESCVLDPAQSTKRMLIIPANSSAVALIGTLRQNDGIGILCETEADTLANTLKQEWGNISDILRKAYHHEFVSLNRKTEFVEIDTPRLSVVLTGTPGQILGIIPSAENGLFSRFSFYNYQTLAKWRDVSPDNHRIDKSELFGSLGQWFAQKASELAQVSIEFRLSPMQWQIINTKYDKLLKETQAGFGVDGQGMVTRSGLMVFRLAMVLSATRRLGIEGKLPGDDLICNDSDFRSALGLAEIYFQHAVETYKMLPRRDQSILKAPSLKFYAALPDKELFSRAEAVAIGQKIGIADRTTDNYLADLLEKGFLVKEKVLGQARKYRKI